MTSTERRAEQLTKLRSFLREEHLNRQAFNSRNVVGDTMTEVYRDGGITVDFCMDYDYIEIFGLTYEEFNSLKDIIF